MKFSSLFGILLLIAAGCETYPENQATYSSSGTRITTAPGYSTTVTPTYSSTQGAAASSQLLTDTDRALLSAVRQSLITSSTAGGTAQTIYVSSRNGNITLTGTVPTEQDRQVIESVVRNTPGVA